MKNHWKRSPSAANAIHSGKYLRLREGLGKPLREQEWIFNRKEKELVFLIHKSRAYGVVVKNKDIDWKA